MPHPFPHRPLAERGQLHRFEIDAPLLKSNPWGDPTTREVLVYWPAGCPTDAPLPALLVLPAFAGTGEGLLSRGLTDVSFTTRLDQLFASGEHKPFAAVFPDVMTTVGGSQFIDSPGIGNYRSHLLYEVLPAVHQRFAVHPRWGVAGRSSGGYGALCLAMDAPELFCAVASHAGDLGFDLCYLGDIPAAVAALTQGDPSSFHQRFWQSHRPSAQQFAAFNLIAMACAYSPDPGASPFPCRLPFDLQTGAIDHEVLQQWRRHDPLTLVDDPVCLQGLRSLELLFLDAGTRDEHLLHLGMKRFAAKLTEVGVPHTAQTFDGGHRGTAYRWEVSLPLLGEAMHRGAAG